MTGPRFYLFGFPARLGDLPEFVTSNENAACRWLSARRGGECQVNRESYCWRSSLRGMPDGSIEYLSSRAIGFGADKWALLHTREEARALPLTVRA